MQRIDLNSLFVPDGLLEGHFETETKGKRDMCRNFYNSLPSAFIRDPLEMHKRGNRTFNINPRFIYC